MSNEIDVEKLRQLFIAINESVYRGSGAGSYYGQYETILTGINKHGPNILLNNTEMHGYTFFTRPKLNLSTSNIRQDRVLTMLDTLDQDSIPFMIRCLLDTKFAKDHSSKVEKSSFIEHRSPFITPLSNTILNISGWPDYIIDTETTDGGFHSEDLTIAKGSDRLQRTYDLSITFRDIQGSIIFYIFMIWCKFKDLVTKNDVVAYFEDILNNRLCYTTSIYAFILDSSTRIITKWAKATMCYPVVVPIGAMFNRNEGEHTIAAATQFTIPFKCNKIDYMDPIVLKEFNMLVERFYPSITNTNSLHKLHHIGADNYRGIPYIDLTNGTNEIGFYDDEEPLDPSEMIQKYSTT